MFNPDPRVQPRRDEGDPPVEVDEGTAPAAPRAEPVLAGRRPFNPLIGTSSLVLGALLLTAALDIVAIVAAVSYHGTIKDLDGDGSLHAFETAEDRLNTVTDIQFFLFFGTAIAFIVWFHAAYKNLGRLGLVTPRWGTKWAIGAWFVPFLSLVRPKSIANDIWRASDPSLPAMVPSPSGQVPPFLAVWWALFLVDIAFGRASVRLWEDAETVSDYLFATKLLIASNVLDIAACVAAIAVVRTTTLRQRRRAAVLAGAAD